MTARSSHPLLPALQGRRGRWVVLALCVLAVAQRAPKTLASPLFWAEDGTVHFAAAWERSLPSSLFFVSWKHGYFQLAANVGAALAAHVLPLRLAPLAPTYVALAFQLLPFLLILFGSSWIFRSFGRRVAGCMVFLFLPDLPGEVWLNTVNSQTFCGIAALLVLLEDPAEEGSSPWVRWTRRVLLLACGLTGVYSFVLAPLFAFSAWRWRSRERGVQAAILGCTAVVQVVLYALARGRGELYPREIVAGQMLDTVALEHWGKAFLGGGLAPRVAEALGSSLWFLVAVPLLAALLWKSRRVPTLWALGLALAVWTAETCLASFGGHPAGRYAVLPRSCVLLLLLAAVDFPRSAWRSTLAVVLLGIALLAGIEDYRNARAGERWCIPEGGLGEWRIQLERWRENPDLKFRVHPHTFSFQLAPRDQD